MTRHRHNIARMTNIRRQALTDALATARIRLADEHRALALTTDSPNDRAAAEHAIAAYTARIAQLETELAS